MKKTICLILSLVSFCFLFAQQDDNTPIRPPLTAPWEIVEVNEFHGVIPYPKIRQSDVMWWVYIWREIDLREKRNHALYFPTEPQGVHRSLGQVILDAIDMDNPENEDALPVYTDEHCNVLVPRDQIKNVLSNLRTIPIFDPDTGEYIKDEEINEPLTIAQIMYYRLKEIWFFDKLRSELVVRILSIEPFFEYNRDGGPGASDDDVTSLKTRRRLGYIKYDELRPYLAQQLYYTPKNLAFQVTFDDAITWKRYFSSYIIAESNPYNREIQEFIKNPRDQRLESERILNQIRNFESELWEF